MITAIALLGALGSQQEPRPIPLPGYLPAHLPAILRKTRPIHDEAMTGSIRGFRSTSLEWEVPQSQAEIVGELMKWYKPEGSGPGDTPGFWMHKKFPDRNIRVMTRPGRSVPLHGSDPKESKFEDVELDKYTTVSMFEYCSPFGPMPKDWPKKARLEVTLPSESPHIPLPGFERKPVSVSYSGFGKWYTATWFLDEAKETAFPRWTEALERSHAWEISRESNATVFRAKDGFPACTVLLENFTPDVLTCPLGWCSVSLQWKAEKS